MKVKIDATEDFYNYLTDNYSKDFSLIKKEENNSDDAYKADLFIAAGTLGVSFLVNIASNFVYGAICNYFNKYKIGQIKVTTEKGIKNITPDNINDEEIKAYFNDLKL